jgi:2-polyprenyl-3-methyl-5-hydroxy-6-metoxy-1,4-benzoquinol methylase
MISRLRGRVLDVGAGEGYYRDTMKQLIREGLVEYHALDPDEKALESLLNAVPQTVVHPGSIEEFFIGPAEFDAVVAVRSINHFKSLHHGLDNITRMLKRGGTLILTDGLALPMVRNMDKAEIAHEASEGGFQHYRNLSSCQVIELLKAYPFDVQERYPVTPDTADEWVVKAIKR